jgi:DNA-binding transcriptional LysR family regulator
VEGRAVVEDRLVVVVPPGHPWAARRRIEPGELAALEAELRGWVVRVAVEGLELARQLWAIWPAQRPLGGLAAELVRLATTAEDPAPAAGLVDQGP